ncbi:efflux transporter outer membrane subunit [Sinomicrobium sp. M5D2P9]
MLAKNIKRLGVVVFLLVAVTGCKVGDPYKRPDFDVLPEEYHGSIGRLDSVAADSLDSIPLAKMKWIEFFGDYDLVSLIDTALVNNIDMQRTVQVLEMSRQDLLQARASFYPSLGFTPFGYKRDYRSLYHDKYGNRASRRHANESETPPTSLYTQQLSYNLGVSSSWEIGLWGKLRWKKDAARAAYMQSEEFKKAVQTALVAEVASTYYELLKLKAELAVAERNLNLNENTLRIVELQYEAGEATSLAVRQTKSQKLRFEALIPQIEREYALQENRLNALLGREPQPIEIHGHLDNAGFKGNYNTGVPMELLQNRPDVAASEYELIASNAQVGIAQALKYPSLTIDASMGLDSYQPNKLFSTPAESLFAVINGAIFQPIFQQRKLKTNYKKALARRQLAQLDFKETIIDAVREVSDAMITLDKLEEEHVLTQERLNTTQRGVTDAALLFRSGFANYLEVITAQSDALDSELGLIDIKMQILLANIELYRSLGGGWQ